MPKVKDLSKPVRDSSIELIELARKEMIHAFDNDKMILSG